MGKDGLDLLRSQNPVQLKTVEHFRLGFDDLYCEVAGSDDSCRSPHRRFSMERRWLDVTVASAAAAVVVLAGVLAVLNLGGSASGSYTTAWQPAHPLSTSDLQAPRGSGAFHLVGAVTPSGWQRHNSGPPPSVVTCPASGTCFASSSASSSGTQSGLYVTSDGGNSWSALELPPNFAFTSSLSCVDPQTCYAAGRQANHPSLIVTTDGGHQWKVAQQNISGDLERLDCTSAQVCSAITTTTTSGSKQSGSTNEQFLHTADGGKTWASSDLTNSYRVVAMSCTGSESCVLVGNPGTGRPVDGFGLATNDGGKSWTTSTLPSGVGFAGPSQISCPTTSQCMALGWVKQNGDIVSAVLTTTDGGHTWQLRSLPASVPQPQLIGLSCSSTTSCSLAGQDSVPMQIGKVWSGGSPVVLTSTDFGSSWSIATFTPPSNPPGDPADYFSIGAISCAPSTAGCVALGIPFQGSAQTPVYSDLGAATSGTS